MNDGIQYSFSLPTHYDCCPMFNAICQGGPQIVGRDPNLGLQIIYRLYVQQEKHITGTCNVIEQGWAINLARGPL